MRDQRQESEEFEVKVGMHQGSVLSPSRLTIVADVVTESARESVFNEFLHVDYLGLINETIEGLRNKFRKWKIYIYIYMRLLRARVRKLTMGVNVR